MRRITVGMLLVTLLSASLCTAAVRRVKTGVVSLMFSEDFIAGLTVGDVDSPAQPAEGFDLGLAVRDDSTFAINLSGGQFAGFRDGRLELDGGITYLTPPPTVPISFSEFTVVWDAEHEPEAFYVITRFQILPVFDVLVPIGDFTAADVSYDDATGRLTVPDFDVLASTEFAELIGVPQLAGIPLGRARMDLVMAAPTGDADDDTDVDLFDYVEYDGCTTGPGGGLATNLCATFDFDDDADVDLLDYGRFVDKFTGPLYTLDVRSEGEPAVNIEITPPDHFGETGGPTPLRNSYAPGTTVTLTAPPDTLLSDFVRWRVEDSDLPQDENVLQLDMETATTVTAVYVSVTSELSVTSTGVSGVPIVVSEPDVYGATNGETDFVRVYPDETEVTLTAPPTASDRYFSRWVVGGVNGDVAVPDAVVVVADDLTAAARYEYIVIHQQPQSVSTCVGGPIELSVTAVGDDLEYQWLRGGVPLPGQTSSTLYIEQAVAADAGTYTVRVSNANATVTSAAALVNVTAAAPMITVHPSGANVCPGNSIFLFTAASGGTLQYQWHKDGEPIPGATSAFFSIAPAQESDSGTYTVEVSNMCGSVTSNDAVIDVDEVYCP